MLFSKGKSIFGNVIGLKFRKNGFSDTRFAVVVGSKVAKSAGERNRIRRKIREVIRVRIPQITCGYDVVILVRPGAVKKTNTEIESIILEILKKSALLKNV